MPGITNPPGTPNSSQLNPQTPATPSNVGAKPVKGNTILPENLPLTDWMAACGSYLVFLWMAEIPTLAPVAVAMAWGTAIIYAITVDGGKGLPRLLVEAVQQGPGKRSKNSNQNLGGTTQTASANPNLGEIVGNAAQAQGIGR